MSSLFIALACLIIAILSYASPIALMQLAVTVE